ncbi:MAG: winged helix-turn-helix domain-containing protein [Nitrososphaerales archaeon]|jgi:biotin operon repressor
MKLTIFLDARGTALASDVKNQLMLKELVSSEYSVTELAKRLNIPTVTVWKRMQKLLSVGMVEVTKTRRSGNLEKRMYRATAARYIPADLLDFRPRDKGLSAAFEVYSQIQKMGMAHLARMNEIPEGADPVDYGLYVGMRAFAEVFGTPGFRQKLSELEDKLSEYDVATAKLSPGSG